MQGSSNALILISASEQLYSLIFWPKPLVLGPLQLGRAVSSSGLSFGAAVKGLYIVILLSSCSYKMVWKQLSIVHDARMDNIEDRPGAHSLFFPWDRSWHGIKFLPTGQALDWAETWQHRQTLNKYPLWSPMLDMKRSCTCRTKQSSAFLPWVSTLSPAGNGFQWHLPGPWEAVERPNHQPAESATRPCPLSLHL